jgi:hypothetical protein
MAFAIESLVSSLLRLHNFFLPSVAACTTCWLSALTVAAADVIASDENLRHGALAGDILQGALDGRAISHFVQFDHGMRDVELGEKALHLHVGK